jgi:hypothetical protein
MKRRLRKVEIVNAVWRVGVIGKAPARVLYNNEGA